MQTLAPRSVKQLAGVHPDLVRVIARALELSAVPFLITEGLRTDARQLELYAQGRTKPGKRVTDTLNSRHKKQANGFGCAVDIVPAPPKGQDVDWKNAAAFDGIYAAMMLAAAELKVPLRSGMDWDRDGNRREHGESDSPHYEIPG